MKTFTNQAMLVSLTLLALLAATADAAWDCEARYQDDPQGFATRLISAVKASDLQCVKYFLKAGDDPDKRDRNGSSPAHFAAINSASGGILQVLIDYKADVDAIQSEDGTPLMMAACRGRTNALTLLIRAGADVDLTNNAGETAADVACECSLSSSCPKNDVLAIIDTSGPGIACEDRYMDDACDLGTRLQLAVRALDLYCVLQLMDKGDSPNVGDRDWVRPLADAAQTRSTEIVQALLRYGAYPDYSSKKKNNALIEASCQGLPNNVDVLIDAGVKVNLKNMYGVTASSGACACNGAPDCPKGKIRDKISERELSSFFNQDFKSDDGILNDGSKTLTQNNRDCNEKCQQTEGCESWTRIKKDTATNKPGECWLRSWKPSGVICLECDSGWVKF